MYHSNVHMNTLQGISYHVSTRLEQKTLLELNRIQCALISILLNLMRPLEMNGPGMTWQRNEEARERGTAMSTHVWE